MRFFLLDRITRWDVNESAEAIKNVSLSEDFFDDHFPRHPLMPGVLIIEGLAQLSGLLLEESLRARTGRSAKAVLTILERTKFRHMVHPGDTLTYRTEVASIQESGGKARAQALLDGRIVTSTEMVFVFREVHDPKLDEKRQALLTLWRREAVGEGG
jgi:3-hydroxymyristoyl/3-hydroxydecanoyl-(acyl carrier protein) dehydratase